MIYIGKFVYANNQQNSEEDGRRHGEFHLIVEAADQPAALEKFRERIRVIRRDSRLFEGRCRIYLVTLLALDRLPADEARMFGYTSVAGDPMMPMITCSAPDGEIDGCRILQWQENRPELDGLEAFQFVAFDG